jgi:hypothetical protein
VFAAYTARRFKTCSQGLSSSVKTHGEIVRSDVEFFCHPGWRLAIKINTSEQIAVRGSQRRDDLMETLAGCRLDLVQGRLFICSQVRHFLQKGLVPSGFSALGAVVVDHGVAQNAIKSGHN